ncbi:MAG: hydrogenase maturation protease [Candidatus Humimicrobiaceae bacterium]
MQNNIFDYCVKPVLILGCGNILFGDDGFGPKVVEYLEQNYSIPENAEVINAGCSVRNILFDIILSSNKPEKIIIIDAVDMGRMPGEFFEMPIEDIPENKIDDFSMHQLPTSNLLKELKFLCNVFVKVYACQPESIPENVSVGLSKRLNDLIPEICKLLIREISQY